MLLHSEDVSASVVNELGVKAGGDDMVVAELGAGLPVVAESRLSSWDWEETDIVLVAGELWLDPEVDILCE